MGRVSPKGEHGAVPGNPMVIGLKTPALFGCGRVGPANCVNGSRRRFGPTQVPEGTDPVQQEPPALARQVSGGHDSTDGIVIRTRPQIVLGTKKELPTQRLAARKLDEILSRINDCAYQPTRIATVAEFAARWREEVLAKRKPSTVRSANSHLDSHILPQLGKLRLDQVGPENQQVFVNQLAGASRKTVLNILSTLSSMLATAKNWGYSSAGNRDSQTCAPGKKFLRCRTFHPFSSRIDFLAGARTVAHVLHRSGDDRIACGRSARPAMAGYRLPPQMHSHPPLRVVRKSSIHKEQDECGADDFAGCARKVLRQYRTDWNPNPEGFCSPPETAGRRRATTSWSIGFGRSSTRSIFRDAVFMLSVTLSRRFIVDAGYSPEVAQQQLRHSNARTTLNYIHLRGGITEQAMADVSNSLKLDAVGRGQGKGSQYVQ